MSDLRVEEQLLYWYEFDYLPKLFYSERGKYRVVFVEKAGMMIASRLRVTAECNGMVSPYTEQDFSAEMLRPDSGADDRNIYILKMNMPVPEDPMAPLCRHIFVCFRHFDQDIHDIRYFTEECDCDRAGKEEFYRSLNLPFPEKENCFICGVDEEGKHLNFGTAPEDQDEVIRIVCDIYCDYLDSHKDS